MIAEVGGGHGQGVLTPPIPSGSRKSPELANAVVLDIETTGLRWSDETLVIAAAYRDVPGGPLVEDAINVGMADLFNHPATIAQARGWVQDMIRGRDWVVFHNGSFDLPYLFKLGLASPQDFQGRVFDTMYAARWTGAYDSVALESLMEAFDLPIPDAPWYHAMKAKRSGLERQDVQSVLDYCKIDTSNTLRLFDRMFPIAWGMYSEDFLVDEGDFVVLVAKMRWAGLPINQDRIGRLLEERNARIDAINKYLVMEHRINGCNDSVTLAKVIQRQGFGEYLGTTDKGGVASDEDTLLKIPGVREHVVDGQDPANDTVKMIGAYLVGKGLQKEVSTWLQGFLDECDDLGLIHPLWGAGGTKSNRLNCRFPAAQTCPKKLDLWAAEDGYELYELDYKQAEIRYMVCVSKEQRLAKAIAEGADIHTTTDKMMGLNNRRLAKAAVFGTIYGGGFMALVNATGCTIPMARKVINQLRVTFPSVMSASKRAEEIWISRGYVVLAWGKRAYASPLEKSTQAYSAFNRVIQGSIAEIVKRAMLHIDRTLPEVKLYGQIHDSLLVGIPKGRPDLLERVKDAMRNAAPQEIMELVDPTMVLDVDATLKGGI
jgi:DNA polymerase I-like protein with 3'-5' exonuclease and polymerase domains